MKKKICHSPYFIFLFLFAFAVSSQTKLNVLFIVVDDLRPQIHNADIDYYNTKLLKTPNLDRLANSGIKFDRAYCQVSVCAASRLSILTGSRPYKIPAKNYGRFWQFNDHLDLASGSGAPAGTNHPLDANGNPAPTMPGIFKTNGYNTQSIGKVYHNSGDDVSSWTYGIGTFLAYDTYRLSTGRPPFEIGVGQHDTVYPDGKYRERGLQALRTLSKAGKPFFLSVGFIRPHLPFNVPEKYWKLYNRADIRLPQNYARPKDAPKEGVHNSQELRGYDLEKDPTNAHVTTDSFAISLIHGYYASVSYTDAMIGALLDELDTLKIRENTVVALVGDHGWNLGDHNMWVKHCLFESALRVPFYISAPGKKAGLRSTALVEYTDLYPTLCELAGFPLPDHLEGTSLLPLMENPDLPCWKGAAYSNYLLGKSVRTNRYRYSEFVNVNDSVLSRMLYDEQEDPMETVNIAGVAGNANLVSTMSKLLNDGWKRAAQGAGNKPLCFDVLPSGKIDSFSTTSSRHIHGTIGNSGSNSPTCRVRSKSIVFTLPAMVGTCSVYLYDLSGKGVIMVKSTATSRISVDIKKLSAGIYYYKINGAGGFLATGRVSIAR